MPTILITGAGRGIGLATAHAFLHAGRKVLALDKDFSSFDLLGAERVEFDLRNLSQIGKLAEKQSNAYFWIDPKKAIAGVYLTQVLPFIDVKSFPLFLEFETAVYRSLG